MVHSFDIEIAVEYGINSAILLQSLAWWCEHNEANERNYYDGLYWTYNSYDAFQKLFPYMGAKQIRSALDRLIEAGLIIKGNHNTNAYDRTLWYAVTEKGYCIIRKGQMDTNEKANESSENGRPIPVINTVIEPVNENDDNSACAREDPPNAFAETCDLPAVDTVQAYAANELSVMGVRAMEELNSFVDDTSPDVVRHAIDNALDQGKRTWSYVRSILNRYANAGARTVAQARAVDDEFAAGRHPPARQPTRQAPQQKLTPQEESDRFWANVPFY